MTRGRKRRCINRKFPLNLYRNRNSFRYLNPETGKFVHLGTNESEAIKAAKAANAYYTAQEASVASLDSIINHASKASTGMNMGDVLNKYEPHKRERCKSERTWEGTIIRIRRIREKFSDTPINKIGVKELTDWLDEKAPNYHSWRSYKIVLAGVFDYAVGIGALEASHGNPARVLIKPIKPPKMRQRLTLEQYKAIYIHAPEWLQVAMDISLQTTLRLGDIITLLFENSDNKYLYVTPKKTQDLYDPVHLKIEMGDGLSAVIKRARQSGIASPFIIHRRPERMQAKTRKKLAHWTQVSQSYTSHAFAKARDKTHLFDDLKFREAPTFHEIRALSSHLYKAAGREKDSVQLLMGHSSEVMTEMYQAGHGTEYAETWANLEI